MASKTTSRPRFNLPVILVALVGLITVSAFWYLERYPAGGAQGPVITAEAKAYVRSLRLSDVEMTATENAIHQRVVEITGKIANQGGRHLNSVVITCIFFDPSNQVVLRERVEIVRARLGGIKPGETKPFRLPFDNLPGNWNQVMPQLVIANIVFV